MKKIGIFSAVTAALALSSGLAMATGDMEDCKVVKDGKGLIKAGKADCQTAAHSCAGQNTAGEADAFITVPKGECAKINAGDFSGVPQATKDRIEGQNN